MLIITGGLSPTKKDFKSLKLSHDAVIAADSGFDTACIYGLQVDVLVGDMDSIKSDETARMKSEVFQHSKDKDYSDTELALYEAKKRCATNITLCGGDGGRLDHFLSVLQLFNNEDILDFWLCKEQYVIKLSSLYNDYIEFVLQKDSVFSVYAVNYQTQVCSIKSKGAKWALDELDWKNGKHSLSNTQQSKKKSIQLKIQKGSFLLLLPYTAIVMHSSKILI